MFRLTNYKWLILCLGLLLMLLFFKVNINSDVKDTNTAQSEVPPDTDEKQAFQFDPATLTPTEYAAYMAWKKQLALSNYDAKTLNQGPFSIKPTKEDQIPADHNSPRLMFEGLGTASYANDRLKGVWVQQHFKIPVGNGFRVDGSVYDQEKDELYAVSSSGHIYKIDQSNPNNMWSIRNISRNFLGNDLNGFNLPTGTFRMVNQQRNGGMEYSDDEGRTWTTANGALIENGFNYKTLVVDASKGKKIIAHAGNFVNKKGQHRIFFSTDNGLNYTSSTLTKPFAEVNMSICKAHNSNTTYAFLRNKKSGKISIYRMKAEASDFSLLHTIPGTYNDFRNVFATEVDGNIHFYMNQTNKIIHYSGDEGKTWTLTSSKAAKKIEEIHPDYPNIIYRGFTDFFMSTDHGASFSVNRKHYIGDYYIWDIQHMRSYERKDGSHFLFVGSDFGCFTSDTPETWDNWVSLNAGSPVQMAYDMVHSNIYNTTFTALQDRGLNGWDDSKETKPYYEVLRLQGTDVLRCALAKNESSLWFWLYYGSIGRIDNISPLKNQNKKVKDFFKNWWASSLVASPDPTEDAVYIPTTTSLQKFTYDPERKTITKKAHPHVFSQVVTSFGYSQVNRDNWYVGLANGQFMYSHDGGDTWAAGSYDGVWPKQQGSWKKTRQVIRTSATDPNIVYYAGRGNTFLKSTDGGKTFTAISNGLDIYRFRDFILSPDEKFIFAACAAAGPWVYSVEENQWFKMSNGATPTDDYTSVAYMLDKNAVRFSTYGSGVIDFELKNNNTITGSKDNVAKGNDPVKLFPNPTDKYLYIEGARTGATVQVFDTNGNKLMETAYKNPTDISGLKEGSYFVVLDGKTRHRFIKK